MTTEARKTAKQQVMTKYPQAACLYVSGCTVAIFRNGKLPCAGGEEPLAMAHTPRSAWAAASKALREGNL